MYGRPVISQEWSVHAQLTISHSRPNENVAAHDIPAAPASSAEHHDSGDVRMEYSWGGQPSSPQPPVSSSTNIPPRTSYGFQRGNILFTTRPPPREGHVSKPSHQPASVQTQSRAPNLLDSGYSSEQISPGSYASLPTRRPAQPYSRRCKSTCSIVLSGSENQGIASASMRPNIEVGCMGDSEDSVCYPSGYKCGDPVCYHQNTPTPHHHGQPKSSDFAPLPETCEVCGGGRSPTAIRRASEANTFTTHFCTRVPDRVTKENQDADQLMMTKPSKDASSQTSDHLVTTSVPAMGDSLLSKSKPSQPKMGNKAYGGLRRKTDSDLLQLPTINIPEPDTEVKKTSSGKRLSRSPAHRLSRSPARLRGQSPLAGWKSRGSQNTPMQATDPSDVKGHRKPRTVHIDVYCTGSEDADASGSSDSSDEMSDSWSSPQTVFESEKVKVVHSRMGKERLPVGFLRRLEQQQRQQQVSNLISRRSESFKCESNRDAQQQQQQVMRAYDSDDGLSSQYPSQASSYSTLRAATESSMPQSEVATTTSRGPSWSTISTSSMALSDEYDSAAATSWKDTATDIDSLVHSAVSLAQSDSFEYADAADRLRIKEKERAWAGAEGKDDSSKTWRSPQLERKHFLQQQKFKEFLEKHLGKSSLPLWKPETTEDSDDDDETGDAWSFCGRDTDGSPKSSTLKREDTVKRVTPAKDKAEVHRSSPKNPETSSNFLRPPSRETGSLSDSGPHRYLRRTVIGPFGSKSPSPPPSRVASSVTSPFTTTPGKRTDQLSKAEKFGTIVGAFRKPGHHVGPSKNPECKCEHCRRYYEDIGYRARTRSVGDMPIDNTSDNNWQASLNLLRNKNGIESTEGMNSNVGTTTLESDLESSITEDASTDNERFVRQHMPSVMGSEEEDNDQ